MIQTALAVFIDLGTMLQSYKLIPRENTILLEREFHYYYTYDTNLQHTS